MGRRLAYLATADDSLLVVQINTASVRDDTGLQQREPLHKQTALTHTARV
jgi:hypothetical protein